MERWNAGTLERGTLERGTLTKIYSKSKMKFCQKVEAKKWKHFAPKVHLAEKHCNLQDCSSMADFENMYA